MIQVKEGAKIENPRKYESGAVEHLRGGRAPSPIAGSRHPGAARPPSRKFLRDREQLRDLLHSRIADQRKCGAVGEVAPPAARLLPQVRIPRRIGPAFAVPSPHVAAKYFVFRAAIH